MMVFDKLRIERATFGEHKGKLTATVSAKYGTHTALEVVIPDEMVTQIMQLITPALAASVEASLLDVQRDHEHWVFNQRAKEIDHNPSET